ncbi:hypothetical protein CYMTET_35915 [Cymbomonas tetramitiformis]|uniref:Uncharacterized protein n=1 Tax=Cymbomonas tetramitiformis TaxID=36881 RepID=A0AAE0F893_9CHLO|nr:hypothetical protein CYMTET_35915 [Cymbomonas tetramitiformis]
MLTLRGATALIGATDNVACAEGQMALGAAGGSYGALAIAAPVHVGRCTSPGDFSRVYGRIFTSWGAAGLSAPWLADAADASLSTHVAIAEAASDDIAAQSAAAWTLSWSHTGSVRARLTLLRNLLPSRRPHCSRTDVWLEQCRGVQRPLRGSSPRVLSEGTDSLMCCEGGLSYRPVTCPRLPTGTEEGRANTAGKQPATAAEASAGMVLGPGAELAPSTTQIFDFEAIGWCPPPGPEAVFGQTGAGQFADDLEAPLAAHTQRMEHLGLKVGFKAWAVLCWAHHAPLAAPTQRMEHLTKAWRLVRASSTWLHRRSRWSTSIEGGLKAASSAPAPLAAPTQRMEHLGLKAGLHGLVLVLSPTGCTHTQRMEHLDLKVACYVARFRASSTGLDTPQRMSNQS